MTRVPLANIAKAEQSRLDWIARETVDAGFRVHKQLGPGLLEGIYQTCMQIELANRDLLVQSEFPVDILYDGQKVGRPLKVDLLIERSLVVELKAVDQLQSVHKAQLLTYLRLADKRLGLLINFNVPLFKNGVIRMAN